MYIEQKDIILSLWRDIAKKNKDSLGQESLQLVGALVLFSQFISSSNYNKHEIGASFLDKEVKLVLSRQRQTFDFLKLSSSSSGHKVKN